MSGQETATTRYEFAQPIKVTLTRGQRGGYGWEIAVQAKDEQEALRIVDEIDLVLRMKYVSPPHAGAEGEESKG